MSDKDNIIKLNEHLDKRDLELILEVNKKAIEIETEMVDQNEEVMNLLNKSNEYLEKISTQVEDHQDMNSKLLEKLSKQVEEVDKNIFKIQVLFLTGLLSLIVQIIQIFKK